MHDDDPISVLLVDDNDSIRSLIRNALVSEEEHYVINEAENGEQAVEFITDNMVDVVILDLQMPITDGWETLRIIRDPENGWPDVKVIMLTVQRSAEHALKSWTIGADLYITKPFHLEQIIDGIQRVCSKQMTA